MKRLLYAVLFLPFILWGGLWFLASTVVSQAISSNLQDQSFDGVAVNVSDYSVGGFPTSLNVDLTDLQATAKDPMLHWRAPPIKANLDILRPNNIKVSAPGTHNIKTSIGDITLISDVIDITTRLILQSALPLEDINAILENVELRPAGKAGIELERFTGLFRRTAAAKYDLDLLVDNLTFTNVLSPEVKNNLLAEYQQVEELNAYALLEFDRDLDRFLLNEPALLQLTAITDFKALARLGQSPILLAGDFNVDEQGLLSGPLSVRVENWRQLHQVAFESGLIPEDLHDFVSNLLGQWSKMTEEENVIEVPLRLEKGHVVFGMFRFGFIPGY